MAPRDSLGEFEQFVLIAILRLRNSAYGVLIRDEIIEQTGRNVATGAVYTTLERLEQKGYVKSRSGEATPERGGKAKRYFDLTGTGRKALYDARHAHDSMWRGLEAAGVR